MKKHLQRGYFARKMPGLVLSLTLLLFCGNSKAQSFIPYYEFTPTISTPYSPITTGTVLATGNSDDGTYTSIPLGFTFVYDGLSYTTVSVTDNGYLRFGNTITGWERSMISDNVPNGVTPISHDLRGSLTGELRWDTFGIAPNRTFVVQWANWSFYSNNGMDTLNFQIVLHETSNAIDFIYGNFQMINEMRVQVGITGSTGYDFLARTTNPDDDWNATLTSGSPWDDCKLSPLGPVVPFNSLTYTFSPPPKVYTYSIVEHPTTLGISPGSLTQVAARLKLRVDAIGSYLPVTSLTVNTTGTTNLSDISNLKVYYTGLSPYFNTAQQFGSTITSPTATNNIITDSFNMPTGESYFWVTYDVSSSATLGNIVDAEIAAVTAANIVRTPVVTAPAGNRTIMAPMTFVSSDVIQNNTSKVAIGSKNSEIIGVQVVMSSTGAPTKVTQLDFDATGTTDTADIRNMKVWYTGNSKSFATTAQFGTTLDFLPGSTMFSITGEQSLYNDTNYFWLTYDINDAGTLANVVDASCNAVMIDGVSQFPLVSSPSGSRELRNDYCTPLVSNAANSCNWGYYISNVTTSGAETNINNYSGCNGNPPNNHIIYDNQTLVVKQNQNINIELGDYSSWITYAIWIDYNQDGVYDNGSELVFQGSTVQNEGYVTGNFTIPCDALPGNTRMRVRGGDYWWWGAPIGDPCADVGYGETEEYNVMIINSPVSVVSAEPVQDAGIASPGTLDKVVLQIPVETEGCGTAITTELRFSTTGTTAVGDIVNAKLYRTGKASFNSSNLLGTVASPSGQFSFVISDTLDLGSSFYWLTYDISASATLTNVVDARLDSVEILGAYYVPNAGNPSGNIQITAPMTYISSTTTQDRIDKVGRGTSDNEIIGVQVVTSAIGAPIKLTQLDFDAAGTTDTANIHNIKVWYTGNNNTFDAGTQFGATLDYLPGTTSFSITGEQFLTNGTNYFWLTYDVDGSSTLGNVVDASCNSLTVGSIVQTPTVTSPTGSREVREEYCEAITSDPFNSCNWGYYISYIGTSGADNDINYYSGCNGNANNYIHYTAPTLVTKPNQTINLTLGDYSSWITYAIWIDYDQDGVFSTSERVFQGSTVQNEGYVTGSFTVPCDALPGNTRMRVRGGDYWWWGSPISDPCADIGLGETEDYDVVILPNPISIASVEPDQQTATTAPGATDKVILSIPVVTEGCGIAENSEMRFSTTGTTAVANILSAKLYRTEGPNFNNNNLLGTVASPSGAFMFSLTDTLVTSGTTYYWLTYDISPSATLTNVVDARLDSVLSLGSYHIPSNGNPSGNIQIIAPMSYVSSEAIQLTAKVGRGSSNNPIIGVKVTTSAVGAPISITQLDFDAIGSTDTADIRNMKVWYTADNDDFASKVQFGTTLDFLPGTTIFSITGTQELLNGDNYFWLTYDINDTAVIGNVVDASCNSIMVAGVSQVPAISSPAGACEIREKYCEGTVSNPNSCNWGYYISNVTTIGAESNISNYSACNGNPNNYIHYTNETLVIKPTQTITVQLGDYSSWITYAVWIDYDQDGIFSASERVFQGSTIQNEGYVTGSFTIPCDALPGKTRMRVRGGDYWWWGTPISDACADIGLGETEDYNVEILPNPVSISSVEPIQLTGAAAAGDLDKVILQLPISNEGCGDAIVTSLNFSTAGSTNASDISSAKLYRTDASETFNTSNLLGTVTSPIGAFSFTVSDTLLQNATTYYWLTYDISGSATTSNVVDARLDSVEAIGNWEIPSNGAPSGNILISTPMTVVTTTVTQPITQKVGKGETNNPIISVMVITSPTGAPVNATQFDFNSNGTTDTADIRNMKVWYTGSNPKFSKHTQFGSTLDFLPGTISFSITGTQALLNDTNYFWLTYDINDTGLVGNFVDAECTSASIGGSIQIPTVSAPTGEREIREKYCTPIVSNVTNACNWGYYINYVSTSGAVQNITNYSGCSGGPNNHIYYDDKTMVVTVGQVINMTLGDYTLYTTHAVWIDYNQDGVFDASERVLRTPGTGNYNVTSGSFTIPASALTGTTRMRIRNADYWWNGTYINSACTDVGIGETEDYNIEILPAPAPVTYVWNQTSMADFGDPSNWTPARNITYLSDKLVFNSGGTVDVEYMPTQTVSSITVTNGTVVNMIAYGKSTLSALDSLNLVSGKIVGNNNVTIGVGADTTLTGVITGTGTVEASIKRWINSTSTVVEFPLSNDTNNNTVSLSYTTPPVGGAITARLITGPTSQAGLPLVDGAITINKVSPYTVWRLTPSNGYSGGVFDGTFNAEGVTYVTNPADLRITRRIASIAAWTLDGTGLSGTGTITAPILGRTGMTVLGEFGIGGDMSVNPLPVTLVSLKASAVKENVLVTWTTATEVNNQGFVVERSVDGKTFTKIDFVKGMGSSNKAVDYSLTDAKAFEAAKSNTLYYRLRQVDYDGTEHISSVVKVNRTEKAVSSIIAYPNPSNTNFNIEMVSSESSTYTYTILDIQGRVVAQSRFDVKEGLNRITIENSDALTSGVYFLRINGTESTTIKLVKTH